MKREVSKKTRVYGNGRNYTCGVALSRYERSQVERLAGLRNCSVSEVIREGIFEYYREELKEIRADLLREKG